MVVKIISREEWGAEPAKEVRRLQIPVTHVAEDYRCPFTINRFSLFKTCTTREECIERVKVIQQIAFKRHQVDLPHNFLIGGDLNIYEGRGWTTLLTDDSLWDGINIGYIGKYTKEEPVPEEMRKVFEALVEYGKSRGFIKTDAKLFTLNKTQVEFD